MFEEERGGGRNGLYELATLRRGEQNGEILIRVPGVEMKIRKLEKCG